VITYKCPKCSFSFNESDRSWDEALMSGSCPKCNSALVNFAVPIKAQVSEKLKLYKKSLARSTPVYIVLIIGVLLVKFSLVLWLGIVGYTLMVFGLVIAVALNKQSTNPSFKRDG
jgi:DNA-directed RNA polymerase subunit RPC12/RpoP